LAHIIQSRMEEILEYVLYHIKQQNLLDKLHGGIILTGGGSQLKHLMQLTQFRTGLDARIGLPNEHLAAGHTTELLKPMYATCIGLILRGCDDYENSNKRFTSNNIEMVSEKEVEAVGVFTTTPQQFEPSVEELLQQEFGTTITPTSNIEMVASIEPQLMLGDVVSNPTTLFQPQNTEPVVKESTFDVLQQKVRKRNETIRKVFTTVQTSILYWFENVEDERIDK